MPQLNVSQKDRQKAEEFLASTLSDEYSDLSFEKGSSLRDIVDVVAHIFAIIRKEGRNVKNATSLSRLSELDNEEDIRNAAEHILANWFITPNEGTRVRGSVLVLFSQKHQGSIPPTATFSKGSLSFTYDSTSQLLYDEADLEPVLGNDGSVVAYVLRVPVVAEEAGEAYEIQTGRFDNWTDFSPYITRVENDQPFVGAEDPESTEELIERGKRSATSRVLFSDRAIRTTLEDQFVNIQDLLIAGYGDREMIRDRVEFLQGKVDMHTGGKTDIYVTTPVVTNRRTKLPVGGTFTDPNNKVTFFDDPDVDDWRIHVDEEDVLYVYSATPIEPDKYIIDEVHREYLQVEESRPFPEKRPDETRGGQALQGVATGVDEIQVSSTPIGEQDINRFVRIIDAPDDQDEKDYRVVDIIDDENKLIIGTDLNQTGDVGFQILESIVEYSIGDLAPDYNNKVSRRTTGQFTDQFSQSGVVRLPSKPVYDLSKVTVLKPNDPYADKASGLVRFNRRDNEAPEIKNGEPGYAVKGARPLKTNSSEQMNLLQVGQAPTDRSDRVSLRHDAGQNVNVVELDPNLEKPLFSADDVDKHIFLFDSYHQENRGEFNIDTFVDTRTVHVSRVYGDDTEFRAENNVPWKLSNRHAYDGLMVRVQYDTVQAFDSIDAFVSARDKRPSPADNLVKAPHPIYIDVSMTYALKDNVTGFSEQEAKRRIANEINTFPSEETLHASEVVSFLQNGFEESVDYVNIPITIDYTLYAPDGRAIDFSTVDAVEMTREKLESSADIGQLNAQSVFDTTVRYITKPSLIELNQE